jgi:hypothetical protein
MTGGAGVVVECGHSTTHQGTERRRAREKAGAPISSSKFSVPIAETPR